MHSNPTTIEIVAHIRHAELQAEAARERMVRQACDSAPRLRPFLANSGRRLGAVRATITGALSAIALAIRGVRTGPNRL